METTRPANSRAFGLVEGIVGRARAEAALIATDGNAFNHAPDRHAGGRLDPGFDASNAQAIFKMTAPVLE